MSTMADEPTRCRKAKHCQLKVNHDGQCGGTVALLRAVVKTQGMRLANWAAAKVLDRLKPPVVR